MRSKSLLGTLAFSSRSSRFTPRTFLNLGFAARNPVPVTTLAADVPSRSTTPILKIAMVGAHDGFRLSAYQIS